MSFASNHEHKFLADDTGVIAELLGCTNDQKLSLFVVQFQFFIQHPITNIINTAFHSSQSNILVNTGIGVEGQIKLAVICITM